MFNALRQRWHQDCGSCRRIACTNAVMRRRIAVTALAWGLAVRPVAIIPDVLQLRGQLTQNEVDLRRLIVLASVALRPPTRRSCRATSSGVSALTVRAGQQAAAAIRPWRRQLALALLLGQLLLQLLDVGLSLLAGLALDLGGRLGMLGPLLGFAQHVLIKAADLRNLGALAPCPIVGVEFLALIAAYSLSAAVWRSCSQSLMMCLRMRAGLIAKVVPYAAGSRSCDRWRSLAAYPKH